MTPPPGRLAAALGSTYRLERELGEGGMATVYLAQDLKHDRKVAIKVLKPELAAVLGAERFVVEIKTTASLQHPHILPLFDSGAADGFLYYVMPYIEGETLRARLDRETQLGVEEAVRLTASVADALGYAHRHGVIHRDIKPENILLHDGRPMVADFGIALAVSAAAGGRMTETGLSLGTPHYMSPEQATAEKEISGRSDIYSLGTVLFEMLAGQPPHIGGAAQQIIMKIITEPAAPVTTLRKSVPPNVAAAVAKALEKLPADRFESAQAFADALGNPGFTSIGAAGPTGAGGGRTGVSRGVFGATAVVAAAAVVVAALGWLRPAPNQAVAKFAIAFPDSQAIVANNTNRLTISPDGRTIVYVGGTGSQSRLLVRRLGDLSATPMPGTEGAYNPAFSPDGGRVAFIAGTPRALKTVALAGGPPTTVTDSLVDAGGVTWAEDGFIYFDGHLPGDGLSRARETGGPPEPATTPDSTTGESWHAAPTALPGGRGILFVITHLRGAGESEIGVIGTGVAKHKILVKGLRAAYANSGHLLYVTAEGYLMAAPFDLKKLELTGPAMPVAEGLAVRSLGRSDIALSRTGTLVYLTGSAAVRIRELVWVSRDGAVAPVDPSWTAQITGRPALSPDGRAALVTVQAKNLYQVWVKQLDRGPASKLTDGGGPAWFPGGREFVFSSLHGTGRGPADGSSLPSEIKGLGLMQWPQVSPDGKWIVSSYGADIYIQGASGDSAPQVLLGGPAIEGRGTISPDGRWIAYQSDESGRTELYVRPFPDVEKSKHLVSVSGGAAPRWSRNGRELYFVDDRDDVMAVPVTLGPPFSAGTPVRLFSGTSFGVPGWSFDVTADGRRFLMTRPAGGGSAQPDAVVWVENFLAELKAKPAR